MAQLLQISCKIALILDVKYKYRFEVYRDPQWTNSSSATGQYLHLKEVR